MGVVGASRPRFPRTKLGSRGLDRPGRPGGSAFWRGGTGRRPWPHEAAACRTQVWAANFPISRPSPPSRKPKAFCLAAGWVRGWVILGRRPSPGATSQLWPGLLQIHPSPRVMGVCTTLASRCPGHLLKGTCRNFNGQKGLGICTGHGPRDMAVLHLGLSCMPKFGTHRPLRTMLLERNGSLGLGPRAPTPGAGWAGIEGGGARGGVAQTGGH